MNWGEIFGLLAFPIVVLGIYKFLRGLSLPPNDSPPYRDNSGEFGGS